MRRYLLVVEKAGRNYSAYLPDVPGFAACGGTVEETLRVAREALVGHLAGEPVPEPLSLKEHLAAGLDLAADDLLAWVAYDGAETHAAA